MTKQELFKKYSIDKSHAQWSSIDDWFSVEIYKIMTGNLPPNEIENFDYMVYPKFLDKVANESDWLSNLRTKYDSREFGSLYLTAKRSVSSFAEQILPFFQKQVSGEKMRKIAAFIDSELKGLGFVLVSFEFGDENRMANYISNANRNDMIKALLEASEQINKNKDFKTPDGQ